MRLQARKSVMNFEHMRAVKQLELKVEMPRKIEPTEILNDVPTEMRKSW